MKSIAWTLIVLWLAGCAGRPSFSKPACARDYDACSEGCEAVCPQDRPYAVDSKRKKVRVGCGHCINGCLTTARTCENALP